MITGIIPDPLPDRSVKYLERIANERQYSIYNAAFKDGAMYILKEMNQEKAVIKSRRLKCLNILDAFAKAGWDEAWELLDVMARQD